MLRHSKQLYGRQPASQAFSECVNSVMANNNFDRCVEIPCFYFNKETGVKAEVHDNVFHLAGTYDELMKLRSELAKDTKLKASEPVDIGMMYQHRKKFAQHNAGPTAVSDERLSNLARHLAGSEVRALWYPKNPKLESIIIGGRLELDRRHEEPQVYDLRLGVH